MTSIRGVILDVDGTLVDSNDAHAAAWIEALSDNGHDVPFEDVRRLIGMGGDKLLPTVIGVEKDSLEGERLSKRRKEIFKSRYLGTLTAFPEVKPLLQHMRDAGLRLVVASSAEEDELEKLLEIAGVTDLIEERTSIDNVEHSKPAPDSIQVALEQLGLAASEAVMVGDTPYDIEAATGAGVATIAFRCGGWHDEDLKGATAIYDAAADLLENFDDSPLGPGPVGG